MAFEQGTASSAANLFSSLSTFLVANGWTDRGLTTAGSLGLSNAAGADTVEVQFRWDTGVEDHVGVYQSTGFTSIGTAPGNHTEDSGQGEISGTDATLALGRHVRMVGATSLPYWFFQGTDYAHVVVRIVDGPPPQFVHFGMGNLVKRGTWTGGAYAYGHRRSLISTSPVGTDVSFLLDGLLAGIAQNVFAATLHAEGLQGMGASDRWALVWGDISPSTQGTDRAANARHPCAGGYRSNVAARFFVRPSAQASAGLIPLVPIPVWYVDQAPSPSEVFPLGEMPDVFSFNIEHFNGGDTIDVGGETYIVFPSWRNAGTAANETRYQGIAYRQVS